MLFHTEKETFAGLNTVLALPWPCITNHQFNLPMRTVTVKQDTLNLDPCRQWDLDSVHTSCVTNTNFKLFSTSHRVLAATLISDSRHRRPFLLKDIYRKIQITTHSICPSYCYLTLPVYHTNIQTGTELT